MAKFYAGQRVRVISHPDVKNEFVGREGQFMRYETQHWLGADCSVNFDGIVRYGFSYTLAPLTDPAADAFLERIKKLGTEPVVLTPKQLEEAS